MHSGGLSVNWKEQQQRRTVTGAEGASDGQRRREEGGREREEKGKREEEKDEGEGLSLMVHGEK